MEEKTIIIEYVVIILFVILVIVIIAVPIVCLIWYKSGPKKFELY